jgi:hypothetical protein
MCTLRPLYLINSMTLRPIGKYIEYRACSSFSYVTRLSNVFLSDKYLAMHAEMHIGHILCPLFCPT